MTLIYCKTLYIAYEYPNDTLISDKTVKLWKISEREKKVADGNYNIQQNTVRVKTLDDLTLPRLEPMELVVEASPRRVYANAHTYHINSISINADQVMVFTSLKSKIRPVGK